MKAYEAREASIQAQFDIAMKEIEEAVYLGVNRACVCEGTLLYRETAEMLANEGYDVKLKMEKKGEKTYVQNMVSWQFAAKGREGRIEEP